MNRIETLTASQTAELSAYRDKWLEIGLATGPCDIARATIAVNDAYDVAGMNAPGYIYHFQSPYSAAIGAAILKNDQVRAQVRAQVWAQVRAQVGDQVRAQVWDQVWAQIYGNHDAGWLSFYDFFSSVCDLECCLSLNPLCELAKHCGWWAPYENAAILQDRPSHIHLDDDGRLHHDSRMACEYSDGFGVWAIHGVRVDEQIVCDPSSQTISQIREDDNAERTRIRIERFGWERYLTEINATVVDARRNDMEVTQERLFHCDGMAVLVATCKTGRLFSLEVPPEIDTCENAQNWLHDGSAIDSLIGSTRVVGRT